MIKFLSTLNNGDRLIGLILSHKNLDLLREGKPIHFSLGDLKIPGYQVLITAGKTEQSVLNTMKAQGFVPPGVEMPPRGFNLTVDSRTPEDFVELRTDEGEVVSITNLGKDKDEEPCPGCGSHTDLRGFESDPEEFTL